MPKTPKAKQPQKVLSTVSKNRPAKLKRKDFEKRLAKLQAELVKLQLWVQHKGLKVIVIFEGRDAAGKAASSSESRKGSAPESSVSLRYRRRPSARSLRCISSDTSRICPLRER